jgi:hypothetical protein
MSPTIRIDDEVYGWLKEQAEPFDDTPNSVLRRVAGLDAQAPQNRTPMVSSRSSPPRTVLRTGGGGIPHLPRSCQRLQRAQDWGLRPRETRGDLHQPGRLAAAAQPLLQRLP